MGVITLHRPRALNALCDALFEDLIHAVRAFEEDDDIGCIVITGSGKAFAAGEGERVEFLSDLHFASFACTDLFSLSDHPSRQVLILQK